MDCIENKRKDIQLIEYKKLVKTSEILGIDSGNNKLITVQEGIKKNEQWERYLKDKMAGLWRQDVAVSDKRRKKGNIVNWIGMNIQMRKVNMQMVLINDGKRNMILVMDKWMGMVYFGGNV